MYTHVHVLLPNCKRLYRHLGSVDMHVYLDLLYCTLSVIHGHIYLIFMLVTLAAQYSLKITTMSKLV